MRLFTLLIAFALSATINVADLSDGADIYANKTDSIQAEELTLIDGGDSREITEFPFSLGDLSEKDYTLKSGEKTLKLHVDNTAPDVSVNIEDGKTYKKADVKVTVTGADTQKILLDGEEKESEFTVSENGTYKLVVEAEDKAHNKTTLERSFSVYSTAPKIEVTGADSEIQKDDYDISVEITSEKDIDESYIKLDGKEVGKSFKITEEGKHKLEVYAKDSIGNESTVTKDLEIDRSVPDIDIRGIDKTIQNTDYEISVSITGKNEITEKSIRLDDAEVTEPQFTVTEEGAHTLEVHAKDILGNEASETVTFTIDKTAPEINAEMDITESFYTAPVKYRFTGADKVTLDGEPIESEGTIDKEGTHVLKATASDEAGNETVIERNFTIDMTAPEIDVKGIDGKYFNEDINYEVSVSEGSLSVTIEKDGETVSKESSGTLTQEGTYRLTARSIDEAGNSSETTVDFVIDRTAPVIKIEKPDKTHYNTDVEYKVSSDEDLTVKVDGEKADESGKITSEGKHTITASASDKAGNTAMVIKDFTIDKTAPVIEIKGIDKSDYNTDVHYEVSCSDPVSVIINEEAVQDSGTVSNEGRYYLTAVARDEAGNISTAEKTFTIDKTEPVIKAMGLDKKYYNTDVNYEVTSEDPVSVKINNEPKENKGSVSSEGTYELVAVAEDKAGNRTTLTRQFIIDKTDPIIGISGIDKEYFNTDVNYAVSSGDALIVTVNGVPKEARGTLTEEGSYELKAVAVDNAENKTTAGKKFIIDKTDPVITIKGIDKEYFNTDVVYGVECEDSFSMTLDGVKTDRFDPVTEEGKHTLTVNAIDKAGNTSEKTVSFIIDKTAPKVDFNDVSFTNDLRKVKASITETHRDSVDIKAVCGNREITNKGNESVSLDKDDKKDAKNDTWTFTVTAADKAGNVSVVSKDVVRDTVSPSIKISDVKKYVNEDVTLIAEIDDANEKSSVMTIERGNSEKEIKGLGKITGTASAEGEYKVSVKSSDKAGNTAKESISFTMDKTDPEVKISAPEGHCKSVDKISAKSNEEGSIFLKVVRDGKTKFDGKAGSYSDFSKNGIYKITAYSVDRAGNKSRNRTAEFIVDNVAPKISLTGARQGEYYNKSVKLTASVNERFFEDTKVNVSGTIEKHGNISIPFKCSGKATNISKTFSTNGIYHVKMTAKDKAGNSSATKELSFIVDTQKPEIEITVPENGGYDSLIAPKVTVKDEFYKSRDISLSNSAGKVFKDSFGKTGGSRIYSNFEKLKENDGIYTLTAKATDLAGNVSTVSKTFTVNRFGSVFKTVSKPDKYSGEATKDVVIKETNVSGIKSYKCYITRDADRFEAKKVRTETNGNDTKYTISRSNFDKEGVYKVYIETLDNTGNKSKSEPDFSFTIDKTPPVITYTGVESGQTYKENSVKMYISATDSLSKETELSATIDGKNAPVREDDDGSYITVGSGYKQKIVVRAEDKAKNSSEITVDDVNVTTSGMAFFVTHKKATAAGAVGLAAAAGLAGFFAARKKKEDKGDDITL